MRLRQRVRDVINGDSRSRDSFFTYAILSVVGLKGIDKVGKVGKLGKAGSYVNGKMDVILSSKSSKKDLSHSVPYNVSNTGKLKVFVQNNVMTNLCQ